MKALTELKKFLADVWREVRPTQGRVTWPAFKSVKVSTVVVMVAAMILGFYIAGCDWMLGKFFGMLKPTVG